MPSVSNPSSTSIAPSSDRIRLPHKRNSIAARVYIQRIRGFTTMRYINRFFTYLLTLLTYLLPASLRVAQPCRYCFYSVVQKWVFRPTGMTRCPDKREIWHVCQISRLSGRKCGNTAPKTVKISILARNLYLRGDSFAIFLRNSQRLYASIGSF